MTGLVCPHCKSDFDSDKRVVRADVTECKLCQHKFVVTQKTLKAYQEPVAVPIQPPPPTMPTSSAPVKINCPNCSTELQGQILIGQILQCPECHKQFEATHERLNAPTVLARAAPMPANHKPKSIAGKLALIFLGLIVLFAFIMPDNSDTTAPDVETASVPAPIVTDPNAPARFLSAWDGSNRELVTLVRSQMKDPKSFEHVETRFNDNGSSLKLYMTYRGKNSFNATVTNQVTADLSKATRTLSNVQEP